MKAFAGALLFLLLGAVAHAQSLGPTANPTPILAGDSLVRGAWEFSALGGGGSGLGKSDKTQFFYAGGRAGRVLTAEHLPGILRGNFEWAVDLLPVYSVFTPNGAVYGASFKPVIWQWNFTRGRKIVPYAAIAGGIVFTTRNIPPGDTSSVNFTPQASFGAHLFECPGRALLFEVSIAHLSSASLGARNPGYNASILFSVGYAWFRRSR